MIQALARLISFLTNPLLLVLPTPFILVYKETQNVPYALKWTLFSAFFMIILGLFVLLEVKRGIFTNLDVSKREQRPLLFEFMGIIALTYLSCLVIFQGPKILFFGIIGVIIALIVVSIVNTKIKASIHVATISAIIITLGILFGTQLYALLLVPIVAWSRVKIKRHTLEEAFVGGMIGSILTILMYVTFKYIFQIHL